MTEASLRIMRASAGKTWRRAWHRDCKNYGEHVMLIMYLSDVDETTHCFSVRGAGGVETDVHAPAGTAVLCDAACEHTVTARGRVRRSFHAYFTAVGVAPISDYSELP